MHRIGAREMVKRKRDFKAEYKRRKARGLAMGFSLAQARGHRRASEAKVERRKAEKVLEDAKFQIGLRFLRKEKSFSKAAREVHISPERLRTYAVEKGIVEKRGRRWVVRKDLPRQVLIFSDGLLLRLKTRNLEHLHDRKRCAIELGMILPATSGLGSEVAIVSLSPWYKLSIRPQSAELV